NRSRTGQLEVIAAAVAIGRDAISRHAVRLALPGVDKQIERIDLCRLLEEHAVRVLRAAGRGVQRPGGVFQRELELARVAGLVREPALDMGRERELVEFAVEQRSQLALERVRVHRLRFRRLDLRAGAPLDELAFDAIERRELVVAMLEPRDLVDDAEELGEEAFERRGEIEQQSRGRPWRGPV